jgi:hypothetical protein
MDISYKLTCLEMTMTFSAGSTETCTRITGFRVRSADPRLNN